MRAITITYDLNPPFGTQADNSLTAREHIFDVKDGLADGQKKYYEALRGAIGEAKNTVGEELTAWRDAVGSKEQDKEVKKGGRGVGGEDEEVEESSS
jgi:hypothetical protein